MMTKDDLIVAPAAAVAEGRASYVFEEPQTAGFVDVVAGSEQWHEMRRQMEARKAQRPDDVRATLRRRVDGQLVDREILSEDENRLPRWG